MSDESAFLAAVSANPDDDTARLVYADWLQERDDPRAEYVRLEVRRYRMTAQERKKDDPFHQLEKLRPHATPDWLSRIDRVGRLSMFWPQDECRRAEAELRVGQPLVRVESRSNHNTQFPKVMTVGDYLYVLTFRNRTLFVVSRMRVRRRVEETVGPFGTIPAITYTAAVEGTEGIFAVYDRESNSEPNRLVAASVGVAIPADSSMHGYLSEHHSFGETDEKAGEYAEDLAASMLATTLAIEFDPELDWDEREHLFKMSGKIVRTSNITQSAVGNKDGLWTTVVAAGVFINDDTRLLRPDSSRGCGLQ